MLTLDRNIIRRLFKADETRFYIGVGLKVVGLSLLIQFFIYYFIYQILKIYHSFFLSQGFPEIEDTPFYDFLLPEAMEGIGVMLLSHFFLFFLGVYIGWLILRPFRELAYYCEHAIENKNLEYHTDDFSTYKLLTRYSEFFVEYLRECRRKEKLQTQTIPPQYQKVHHPTIDKLFIFHLAFLIIIISLTNAAFIIEISTSAYESLINLALDNLKRNHEVTKFFSYQSFVMSEITNLTVVLTVVSYLTLAIHLYKKISGAGFAIFSTMRSFMKGNYSARVHMLGFPYIRNYSRLINKYLDFMQKNYDPGSFNSSEE